MEENLANHRRSYERAQLTADRLTGHPMGLFKTWFDEVETADTLSENNAMTLGTLDEEGFPKNRIVLLKEFNDRGFVFYTNYKSEKGRSIQRHPKVSLSFFWSILERQVIVKGCAEKLPPEQSDHYFASRPRGSQLGARVSHQSQPIANREVLENRLTQLQKTYQEKPIPRPAYWGGVLVRPVSVEFWQGRPNRLHDRFRYLKQEDGWQINRLAP